MNNLTFNKSEIIIIAVEGITKKHWKKIVLLLHFRMKKLRCFHILFMLQTVNHSH